jgi:hypothetical protein
MKGFRVKRINSSTIMIILILFSVAILGYVPQARAYTGVTDVGSGTGIITCPTGEQHEGPIAFEGVSTPSFRGAFDISTSIPSASGEVLKSGVINYVEINPSGEFILKGKETRDDICGGLGTVASIPIVIAGVCDFNPASGVLGTVKFRAANGEKADFPSSPTCS